MAVKIELKRSSVPGKIPTTASLELGELAINTYDGVAYLKREVNTTQSIVALLTTAYTGSYMESSSYAQTASYAPNYTLLTSFDAFTSSYSTGSFTGSFSGDGSGLTNLPTQSVSIDTGSFATTGSNTFYGDQTISGSAVSVLDLHGINDGMWWFRLLNDAYNPTQPVFAGWLGNDGTAYIGNEVDTSINIYTNAQYGSPTVQISSSGVIISTPLTVNNGITGSLFGTASWAEYAVTASYINQANIPAPLLYQIATGSVTASVSTNINQIFLIKSGSSAVVGVDNSGSITTSGSLTINTTGSYSSLVSVNNDGTEYLRVNGEGVLVLNQFATPPTAISGGVYLDTVGDFYFGI